MKMTTMALGTLAVFLGASMMASAYHIDYDKFGPNPADEWINPDHHGLLIGIICESGGQTDKVNELPAPVGGIGGLCYASSQDFATWMINDPLNPLDDTVVVDKSAVKAKKANAQNEWGIIQPYCSSSTTSNCGIGADPDDDPLLSESKDVFGDWFARIGSNAHSCTGEWDQAFAYKEMIAYYAGGGPMNNNGVSGHVAFFVTEQNSEGSYNRAKTTTNPIDMTKTLGADPNLPDDDRCTGEGKTVGLTGALKTPGPSA